MEGWICGRDWILGFQGCVCHYFNEKVVFQYHSLDFQARGMWGWWAIVLLRECDSSYMDKFEVIYDAFYMLKDITKGVIPFHKVSEQDSHNKFQRETHIGEENMNYFFSSWSSASHIKGNIVSSSASFVASNKASSGEDKE
ncbi:hypothetical protein JHK87_040486 [Glycine soja]|nr:hypothetical protein JHK87_040486 [Glycine soja]